LFVGLSPCARAGIGRGTYCSSARPPPGGPSSATLRCTRAVASSTIPGSPLPENRARLPIPLAVPLSPSDMPPSAVSSVACSSARPPPGGPSSGTLCCTRAVRIRTGTGSLLSPALVLLLASGEAALRPRPRRRRGAPLVASHLMKAPVQNPTYLRHPSFCSPLTRCLAGTCSEEEEKGVEGAREIGFTAFLIWMTRE
jgi:hypothetical protein